MQQFFGKANTGIAGSKSAPKERTCSNCPGAHTIQADGYWGGGLEGLDTAALEP